jgi:hypothetical protein
MEKIVAVHVQSGGQESDLPKKALEVFPQAFGIWMLIAKSDSISPPAD